MYDYMKALQKHFDCQEHGELDAQIEYAQAELRRDMDAAGRRKLLRLIDAQNVLLVEATLMSFTAGFKLAWAWRKSWRQTGSIAVRRNRRTKWQNEGRPVTAWYESGRTDVGKAVLSSATRKTVNHCSVMSTPRCKRNCWTSSTRTSVAIVTWS